MRLIQLIILIFSVIFLEIEIPNIVVANIAQVADDYYCHPYEHTKGSPILLLCEFFFLLLLLDKVELDEILKAEHARLIGHPKQ